MKTTFIAYILIAFIITSTRLLSIDSTESYFNWLDKIGITSSFDYYFLSTDLRQIPTIPDSIRYFATGYNFGFSLGFYLVSTFSPKLSLSTRFLYMNGHANISGSAWSESNISNKDTLSLINHEFTTDLSAFTFEPLIEFETIKNLSIIGGFYFSYRINNPFQHNEYLIKPDTGTFYNGSRTRIVEKEFQSFSSFQSAFTTGIAYKIPFTIANNGNLTLSILYSYGFTSIADNFIWDLNIARAGINFEYSFNPPEKKTNLPLPQNNIEIKEEPKDTIGQITEQIDEQKAKIDLKIFGFNLQEEGKELKTIEITEYIRENSFPLLNFIFFDNGSYTIPDRYYKISNLDTKNYIYTKRRPIVESINKGIDYVYHDILNILGYRLKKHKNATINLIGCNSDTLNETNDTILSFNRAKEVRYYLESTWEILPNRITTEVRNLPKNPSNNNSIDGIEENQRVEITSNSQEILAPVEYEDTVTIINPLYLRFRINTLNIKKILQVKISIIQDILENKVFEASENIPENIEVILEKNIIDPIISDYIYIRTHFVYLDYKDIIDSTATIDTIRVVKNEIAKFLSTKSGKTIEKYNLILFDFNKSTIDKDKLIIINKINNKISSYDKNNTEIKVYGYTDRVGDAKYNLGLSKLRAIETAKLIKFHPITTAGFGEDKLIFDNSLPEGRFYSRTVEIIIERNK